MWWQCKFRPAKESDVMLNEMLALSNGSTEQSRSAEVKHLCNTIKGDPSLRSG